MNHELIIVLAVGFLFLGGLLWVLLRRREEPTAAPLQLMQAQMDALRQQVSASLSQNAELLQKQLAFVSTNLQSSSGEINQRLDNAARMYADLRNQLGQLSQSNLQIQAMVKDVSSLQDILRPPKLRGGMGEVLLENLLREILPAEYYETQHRFQSGQIVDVIIRLKEGMVPVDAKFPLENFKRMIEATEAADRSAARKEFVRNVKKHIQDIHDRYICTDEGTFPFALMYIPAENVYYETIIKGEEEDGERALYTFAIQNQVMPVSPNSFYAYLLTLSQGFRGMRIEERAKEILTHLNRLKSDLEKFADDFRMVGRHLTNAQSKFGDAEKKLTRFEDKLGTAGDAPAIEQIESIKPASQKELL